MFRLFTSRWEDFSLILVRYHGIERSSFSPSSISDSFRDVKFGDYFQVLLDLRKPVREFDWFVYWSFFGGCIGNYGILSNSFWASLNLPRDSLRISLRISLPLRFSKSRPNEGEILSERVLTWLTKIKCIWFSSFSFTGILGTLSTSTVRLQFGRSAAAQEDE